MRFCVGCEIELFFDGLRAEAKRFLSGYEAEALLFLNVAESDVSFGRAFAWFGAFMLGASFGASFFH